MRTDSFVIVIGYLCAFLATVLAICFISSWFGKIDSNAIIQSISTILTGIAALYAANKALTNIVDNDHKKKIKAEDLISESINRYLGQIAASMITHDAIIRDGRYQAHALRYANSIIPKDIPLAIKDYHILWALEADQIRTALQIEIVLESIQSNLRALFPASLEENSLNKIKEHEISSIKAHIIAQEDKLNELVKSISRSRHQIGRWDPNRKETLKN